MLDYEKDLRERIEKAMVDMESSADMAESMILGSLKSYQSSDADYFATLSCYKQYVKLNLLIDLYNTYFPDPDFRNEKEKMEKNLSEIEKKIVHLMKS